MSVKFLNTVKIVLIVLFLLCLFDMPYGFYNLVRFLAMVGFALLAYASYKDCRSSWVIVYVVMALLFQPLAKIELGHVIWNIVDVFAAIMLVVTIYLYRKKN